MTKYLLTVFAAIVLAACGPQGGATGSMDTPQHQDSGMNPWLAGAMGYFAGRMMSPSAAPQQNIVAPTVVERRTIIINKTEPPKNEAPKTTTPPVASAPSPKPVVPSYAPKPSYQQAPAPRVTYSQSFSRPSTSSGRR